MRESVIRYRGIHLDISGLVVGLVSILVMDLLSIS